MIWSLVGVAPTFDSEGKVVGSMSVHTDITTRKRAEEQLLHNAMHDGLTGLPNRALFLEHLRRAMGRSPRREKTFAVLFLDFDGFKLINDSLGHEAGDNLLKMIALRLGAILRGDDVVARLGGDEFTILLDELTDSTDALFVADRVQDLFKESFDLGGRKIFIGASIGIALRDAKYRTPEDLLRDADIAMYRAKSKGKARHEIFNREMASRLAIACSSKPNCGSRSKRASFRFFISRLWKSPPAV
ncbi:MAG: diguanylate cyclase domain-containing protein [Pyrinomonadaceae bacterium]